MSLLQHLIIGTALMSLSPLALAEAPAFEGMCRQKAKEVAAETYRGCVTENKKAQIDQLKNDYQSKLRALKDEYDGEIKKLSGAQRHSEPAVQKPMSSQEIINPRTQNEAPVIKKNSRVSRNSGAARAYPVKPRKTGQLPADSNINEDMSLRLHPAERDDSTMDIPEPIPVESVPESDSQI